MNNSIYMANMMPSPKPKHENAKQREEKKEMTEEFSSLGAGALVAHSVSPVAMLVDIAEVGTKLFSFITNKGLNEIFDKTMGSINNGHILDSIQDYFQKMMSISPSSSVINLNASKLSNNSTPTVKVSGVKSNSSKSPSSKIGR